MQAPASSSSAAPRDGSTSVPIGALLDGLADPLSAARRLDPLGLESVALSFWEHAEAVDLGALAAGLEGRKVSALSVYGNVLGNGEAAALTRKALERLVRAAPDFGATVVGCFAGRVPGASVPESLEAWKAFFGPLSELASARGVLLGFENCRLGDTWKTGKWNIAINPDAWTLMFEALPGAPLGLEWEPAHQILAMADPHVQLAEWASRVVHVHAKDARLDRAALDLHGVHGSTKIGAECLAGLGDSDWARLFSILAAAGYKGCVDVEIGSDPVYHGAREAEGIALAAAGLRKARACAATATATAGHS